MAPTLSSPRLKRGGSSASDVRGARPSTSDIPAKSVHPGARAANGVGAGVCPRQALKWASSAFAGCRRERSRIL